METVSHAMIPNGGVTNAKTHARKAAGMGSATEQMESAQAVAKTDFMEKNVTKSARVGAKVALATKKVESAPQVARLVGVVPFAMKLVQKALVQKDVIVKLDSPYHACLAVIPSNLFSMMGGSARVVQTIARTTSVTTMADAQKDVK